jgi:inosose dehydratase
VSYADAVKRGLFRALGDGGAGIADALRALAAAGYAGWGVLEQDIALGEPPTEANDPARDVARSRDFARAHA